MDNARLRQAFPSTRYGLGPLLKTERLQGILPVLKTKLGELASFLKDIDFVNQGQAAEIKVETFPLIVLVI